MLHHRGIKASLIFFFERRDWTRFNIFFKEKKSHIFVHPSIDCILIKQTKYMYM